MPSSAESVTTPHIPVKLPDLGTTIFSVMSAMAREYRAINLSQGFPDFPSNARLIELVHRHMMAGRNQYAPMPGLLALRERLAEKIHRLYGAQVDPGEGITITAGATQAIFTAITAFVQEEDEVILFEPAYDAYGPVVELCGGKVRAYEMTAPDYRIDWQAVAGMINERTRMIVINTPHNPTGAVLEASDMEALEDLIKDTDILVLSDEVYEHLIYDGREHQSALRCSNLRPRTIATYSFGKTFHNTGWKIGYCVAPPALMREFRKIHQYNVFAVNTPIQYALADFLEDPQEYLQLPDFYQRKRDFLLRALEGSRLRPLACDGTYFQLFDYRAISEAPDSEFAQWLIREKGVATIPVSAFYSSDRDDRVIRLCFAKEETTLEAAAEVLCRV